jgi:CIC family chloride channel protein
LNSISSSRAALPTRGLAYLRQHLQVWTQRHEEAWLLLMASLVGLAMGVASVLFRMLLRVSHRFFHREAETFVGWRHWSGDIWSLLGQALLPAAGGLVVGLLIYRILRLKGGHGVPSVMKAVATGKVNLHPSMAIKSASAPITIATGGSAGPEGPIIEIGAVVGSSIGSLARARKDMMGTLVGCGGAAGIAAMFNAPIGGVVFALELIMRDFHVRKFGPIVIAAVIASVTSSALLPNDPAFHRLAETTLQTIEPSGFLVLQFLGLGAACAAAGVLLINVLYWFHDLFHEFPAPLWVKPAIGGLTVGLIGLLAPGVLGEGYETVNRVILAAGPAPQQIGPLLQTLVILALLKILVTSITLGSGGTGGTFAPAMVAGALVGAAVGLLADRFFPTTAPDFRVFAMVGMAGVVGSSLGTPLAGVLIIYEVAGGRYELVLPLMITVAMSTLLASRMRKGSIYTLSLLRDGFDVELQQRRSRDPLEGLPVRDLMSSVFLTVRPDDPLPRLLALLEDSEENAFAVSDERGRLCGVISTNDLRSVVNLGDIGGAAFIAADIVDSNAPVLRPDSPAGKALEIFSTTDVEGIAVVEDEGGVRRCVGMVFRGDVLRAYRRAARSGGG